MGMSASQARYLSLIARQSNLEYQGQQINQERTILSQQVTSLYNSLLAIEVPTPPSTQDYSKVVYSATDGATNYTFDASDVKPGKDGAYSVVLSTTEYGQSLQQNKGYAITSGGTESIKGTTLSKKITETTKNGAYEAYTDEDEVPDKSSFVKNLGPTKPDNMTDVYIDVNIDVVDSSSPDAEGQKNETELVAWNDSRLEDSIKNNYNGNYYKLNDGEFDASNCMYVYEDTYSQEVDYKLELDDLENLYIVNEDGTLTKATINDVDTYKNSSGNVLHYTLQEGKEYFLKQAGGTESKNLPVTTDEENAYTIAGKNAMTLEYAKDHGYITEDAYSGYCNAITNAAINSSSGNACKPEDFYIYFDDDNKVHFALKTDVQDGNGGAVTYDFISNGQFKKPVTYDDCELKFDVSSGRITSIDIPTYGSDGQIISYKTLTLEASTETDEVAYNEAMAEYEYKQYLYDKKQQEINAKTEKIQQQDRNLELKLQRLDNERTQITTEIEALDKVINDNIESSYKTFSG